VKNIAKL